MRTIWILIASLLLVDISWAALQEGTPIEESECMVQPANSDEWYPCNSKAAQDANCLFLLEKAMKVADPYLLATSKEKLFENVADQKLWGRVKSLCWSEYKQDLSKRLH